MAMQSIILQQIELPPLAEYGTVGLVFGVMLFLLYYSVKRISSLEEKLESKNDDLVKLSEKTTEALTKATIVMSQDGKHKLTQEEIRDIIDLAVMKAMKNKE